MTKYYFDTYALIEIGKSNPNYLKYLRGSTILLHKLNLMELVYFLKREGKEEMVKVLFVQLKKYHAEASDSAFINAALLKHKYKERRISYIDCIGYQIAAENQAKFLTGDEKFADLPNVEYVK